MRIYQNLIEALSEIRRDVAEMGINVHPQTYQDKNIKDNPDFATKELQNYIYTVVNPKLSELKATQPWADLEWKERLLGILESPLNPGYAWKTRKEIWEEFLQKDGKFAYTYSDRLSWFSQVQKVIERIKEDPDSRQLYISVFTQADIEKMGGISRVPCSLGYYIQIRGGYLHLTYLQRSADLITHFINDIYLALKLQEYLSQETGYPIGRFVHWLGSLHAFHKDLKKVF